MTGPSTEFLGLQEAVAGRYSLERELGRGGMGIVFLARDVALDRPVAIKLLPSHLAAEPAFRERFLREARTAARLSHPHIVPIHLVEERGDLVFFVMAFIEGETLGQRVRHAGPLPPATVGRVTREVAWALAYAHRNGVIHRDIKPENILLERGSGRAMVSDFGIARLAGADTMSARGEIVGTAHFMSPEQATGEPVDGRSDIYSLGVSAFYALTGRFPFDGPNVPAIIHQHVTEPPPRVAGLRSQVPAGLAQIVDRCLAKAPAERFPDAESLAEALEPTQRAVETPPVIRAFVRQLGEAGVTLGLVAFLSAIIGPSAWEGLDPTMRVIAVVLVSSYFLFTPLRVGAVAREVVKAGLSHDHVVLALEKEVRAKREEAEALRGPKALRKEQYRLGVKTMAPRIALAGGAALAIGLVGSPLGVLKWVGVAVTFFGLSLMIQLADPFGRAGRESTGYLKWSDRIIAGPMGRWIMRLAGIGLRPPLPATGAAPTEIVLAAAADDLFGELPSALRARFRDVPRVVAAVRAHVRRLREHARRLDRAMALVELPGREGRGSAHITARDELLAAREASGARLAAAVAALESLRLDLLRLHAGVGSADDLTADLARAREIGEAIDAEVWGRGEVKRLLEDTGAVPP